MVNIEEGLKKIDILFQEGGYISIEWWKKVYIALTLIKLKIGLKN